MKKLLALSMFGGILLGVYLTVHSGLQAVGSVLATAGWGLGLVALAHVFQVALSGLAWHAALGRRFEGGTRTTIVLRWIRESINSMLPVAQIGGEVAGARLLALAGVPSGIAAASVVVDITFELVTQVLFTVLGLLLFLVHGHRNPADHFWLVFGTLIMIPTALVFLVAQRRGMFHRVEAFLNWLAERLPGPNWGRMEGLHDGIHALYREPRAIVMGCYWHLLSWVAGAGEIWLILHLCGADTSLEAAFILESLGQAIRTAAFLVPGAFGVQEGGFMLLGGMFGLAPEFGLGLSLAKRVRELLLGAPGMVAWHYLEGRHLLARRRATAKALEVE